MHMQMFNFRERLRGLSMYLYIHISVPKKESSPLERPSWQVKLAHVRGEVLQSMLGLACYFPTYNGQLIFTLFGNMVVELAKSQI